MSADIAVTPLAAVYHHRFAGKIREVDPVSAAAGNHGEVAPIIILLAVGRKMDVAHLGATGCNFVVAGVLFPQIILFDGTDKCLGKNRLSPVAVGLEHFTHTALI